MSMSDLPIELFSHFFINENDFIEGEGELLSGARSFKSDYQNRRLDFKDLLNLALVNKYLYANIPFHVKIVDQIVYKNHNKHFLPALTNIKLTNDTLQYLNDITESASRSFRLLDLTNTNIKDLSPLINVSTYLQGLYLADTNVKDVTIMSTFTHLRWLNLRNTCVVDISPLSRLKSLQHLSLSGTKVVDVSSLSTVTSLRTLYLWGSRVKNVTALSSMFNERLQIIGS